MPTVASIAIEQPVTDSEAFSLETEFRTTLTAGRLTTEIWANTDRDAGSQVETVTITPSLPTANSLYELTVAGPTATQNFSYVYLTSSSNTAATIAAFLAQIADTHPDVSAIAANNTTVLTSVIPGTNGAIVVTVSCKAIADNSALTGKISTATTAAASGTGKLRKIAATQLELNSVVSSGKAKPQLVVRAGRTFDGSAAAVQLGDWGDNPYTHSLSWDSLIAVA